MTLIEIFVILITHWVADFICQDEQWALGKSKNWRDLLKHTTTYSALWWVPMMFMLPIYGSVFVCVTFIFHTATDYFTSRIVSKKFENKHYGSTIPNFGAFTVIGLDQLLHYFQLFTTYYLLK